MEEKFIKYTSFIDISISLAFTAEKNITYILVVVGKVTPRLLTQP